VLDTRKLQKNEREILGGRCVRGLDMKGFANVTRLEGTNTTEKDQNLRECQEY
jgi:hypothetical protein